MIPVIFKMDKTIGSISKTLDLKGYIFNLDERRFTQNSRKLKSFIKPFLVMLQFSATGSRKFHKNEIIIEYSVGNTGFYVFKIEKN